MSLRQDIFSARDNAMKANDTAALSTLRVLCSDIKNAEIAAQGELDDEAVQKVIARQVKQLKDAATDFAQAGRDDLVAQNTAEVALLEKYLPAQMSDEDIATHIDAVLADMGEGVQMGQVMGAVMKRVAGQADGNRVRELVQQKLG